MGEGVIGGTAQVPLFGIANVNIYIYIYLYWLHQQQLLIFDDMVAEKNQKKIEEYLLRGRKIGRGITIIYISQKYHKTPIFIRANINYLILLKISGQNDLSRILSDYTLAVDLKDFKAIYKDATKSKLDFMKIDIDEGDPNKKISKNWIDYYQIEE